MSGEADLAAAKAQICADIAALQAAVAAAVQGFETAHPGLYINELHSIPAPDPGIAPEVWASVGLRDSRFI
jgi:hypothetical protein